MSIPQILAVFIAMAVVYYLLGMIVSFFTSRLTEFFETRGTVLQEYIKQIVGNKKVEDFYKLPQLESLKPIRYAGFLGTILGQVEVKDKIEKIPVANLTDAFFDFTMIGNKKEKYTADGLKKAVEALPDSTAKTKMLDLINQKVTDVEKLREKMSLWFGGLMDQAAMHYKAKARWIVILLSIGVTIAFAADTIDLARQFWNDSTLLSIATAKASAIVDKQPAADLTTLAAELGELKIQLGWGPMIADFKAQTADKQLPWMLWKILGLALTAAAVSQGSSFWYDILKTWKVGGASKSSAEEKEAGAASSAG